MHRRTHRSDRPPVHRPAARGHAARAEPVGSRPTPATDWPSSAWRSWAPRSTTSSASVTIVNPGGSYTLATEHSPLPLALHNGLAVPIRVRLQVNAPPGMTVTDVGQIELPPGYLPLRVPIEVNFTQRVAIDVGAADPGRDGCWASRCGCRCIPTPTARCCSRSRSPRRRCWSPWPDGGCGTASAASPTAPTWTAPTHPARRSAARGRRRPIAIGSHEEHRV